MSDDNQTPQGWERKVLEKIALEGLARSSVPSVDAGVIFFKLLGFTYFGVVHMECAWSEWR